MKKVTLIFAMILTSAFLMSANQPLVASKVESKQVLQNDWIGTIARNSEGKQLRVQYKLNSLTQKVDTMAGFKAWDGSNWISVFGGTDNNGDYVNYSFSKYYF